MSKDVGADGTNDRKGKGQRTERKSITQVLANIFEQKGNATLSCRRRQNQAKKPWYLGVARENHCSYRRGRQFSLKTGLEADGRGIVDVVKATLARSR